MSTEVYKDAEVLIAGAAIHAQLNELALEYSAEMLDATTFGQDTRVRKGGLKTAMASGAGFADSGSNAFETVLFERVGDDDEVLALFPVGVVEGTQNGYAMRGVVSEFTLGGAVGALLPLSFSFEGRGIEA